MIIIKYLWLPRYAGFSHRGSHILANKLGKPVTIFPVGHFSNLGGGQEWFCCSMLYRLHTKGEVPQLFIQPSAEGIGGSSPFRAPVCYSIFNCDHF